MQIPGITLPLAHLPVQLLALWIAGALHELGHAVAAASARVRVLGVGVFLWIMYPGAFVELDQRTLAESSTRNKLRIAFAGVWHNLILVAIAAAALKSGMLDWPWTWIGWETTATGVVATSIASWSPLHQAVPASSTITQLDDNTLAGGTVDWTRYLEKKTHLAPNTTGYCWSKDAWLSRKPDCQCCRFETVHVRCTYTSLVCFATYNSTSSSACVPVASALQDTTACTDDTVCPQHQVCMFPQRLSPGEQLLRIHYQLPPWSLDGATAADNQFTVFLGLPSDIYAAIRVSRWRPRLSWLPGTLPEFSVLFVR
ncbi:hypothetical protein THASP1DRAFT_15938 [Thamnocephalis sphaerospora]|uniref:Endopeptidase S2P n=1 Tax=Thamnocephalis sphaerospora TaxID=78915 RepID=A0A4P9XQM2_9FUNG|nr:hypothetical protein THASP1DRAFT_15938 [Thamnocephalis sphaerospora]|eukprot:RKP08222.1 hypothetical protein THASP1DRAFT_15938 [Thamnocephalis sphaerospora]